MSTRDCGSSSMTASVNDLVSRRAEASPRAAASTARSRVRDAERRFRPSASISDAVIALLPQTRTDVEHFDEVWR